MRRIRGAAQSASPKVCGLRAAASAATPAGTLATRRRRAIVRRDALKFVGGVVGAAAVAFVATGVVMGVAVVEGVSMQPAYQEGDAVLFFRLARNFAPGDVVLVKSDGRAHEEVPGALLIKRVIAVPGDEVDIRAGAVWVNGKRPEESYAYGATLDAGGQTYPLMLGEDEYFCLGDNRQHSVDSRVWGPAPAADIEGKVLAVARQV